MDKLKVAVHHLCFGVLLLMSHVCLTQECELSFHTEADSLMLLAGQSGSIVCDARCFAGKGVASVTWTDMVGNNVQGRAERKSVYTVTHQRGLVSELVMRSATSDVSGTYTCSVAFGGKLVQSKSKSVIVFDKVARQSLLIPRFPTGPRRGDQLILEDINHRPVRSAKLSGRPHALNSVTPKAGNSGAGGRSEDATDDVSSPLSREYRVNAFESVTPATRGSDLDMVRPTVRDNDFDVIDTDYDTPEDRDYAALELLEAIAWRKRLEKMAKEVPLPDADKHVHIQDPRNEIISRRPVNHELPRGSHRLGENTTFEELPHRRDNLARSENSIISFGLSRHRRDSNGSDPLNDTATIMEYTTNNATEEAETLPAETSTPVSPPDRTTLFGSTSTHTFTERPATANTPEDENGDGNQPGDSDKAAEEDSTKCPTSPEPTNFGKYGILAFAVSLSLAFLLLYAILMILFMPRILARRSARKKSDLEAPIYRKKNSDVGEIPPMPINLNDSTPSEIDLSDANPKRDLNSSLTSQSVHEDDVKKEDTGSAVSTFLLRQASVNKKDNEPGDAKESSADNENTEDISQTKTDLLPSDKPAEAAAKAAPEGESLLSNILTDIASRPETKDAPEPKGDDAEVKSKVRESDFDLPPFPDPAGSDVNKDIIDV